MNIDVKDFQLGGYYDALGAAILGGNVTVTIGPNNTKRYVDHKFHLIISAPNTDEFHEWGRTHAELNEAFTNLNNELNK